MHIFTVYKWLDWLVLTKRQFVYECFYEIITTFMVIPVISCGCERVFSKLTVVKSKLWCTMKQERLYALLFLFSEPDSTSNVKPDDKIDKCLKA